MPSSARSAQIDLEVTPYYHCYARCVRRAFLCGEDPYEGKNFDHRRGWFVERLREAAMAFAIDVCAYAILSNHFHVVLRVDSEMAASWSEAEVLKRYGKFFPRAAQAARQLPAAAKRRRVAEIREHLTDISWFMRVVNEHVARRANKEDRCSGRFWEGRFKSQALLDEGALYTCMSYVDLNPVRAGTATSLKGSDFTSIQQRLREVAPKGKKGRRSVERAGVPLAPFVSGGRSGKRRTLSLRWGDYLELLEWTGRAARAKPGGRLRGDPPAALKALRIEAAAWLGTMTTPASLSAFCSIGSELSLKAEALRRDVRWVKGKSPAKRLFARA